MHQRAGWLLLHERWRAERQLPDVDLLCLSHWPVSQRLQRGVLGLVRELHQQAIRHLLHRHWRSDRQLCVLNLQQLRNWLVSLGVRWGVRGLVRELHQAFKQLLHERLLIRVL